MAVHAEQRTTDAFDSEDTTRAFVVIHSERPRVFAPDTWDYAIVGCLFVALVVFSAFLLA